MLFSFVKYILLIFVGLLLILLCSQLQQVTSSEPGEYYYSDFLRNNFTFLAAAIFFVTGILTGYYLTLNPWLAGICLIMIFPLISLYEATVYRGSHNLLPFEFFVYFLFSLPAVIGVYTGDFIFKKVRRKALTGE